MIVVPVLFAVAAAAMATGCDKPSSYDATLKFDKDLEDGKYPNGTLVQASCKNGFCITDGSSHALCLNGQFVPKLGRCPYHCQLTKLEDLGYTYTDPNPYEGANDYRLHGSSATAYCQTGYTLSGGEHVGHPFKCVDGGWQPTSRHTRCES
ncbi:unnamed protein product [Heligmosomoides polygyrus]|uniref:Sushi domain-containing protein n=1 Tax=Heligmosomoides polygyrus TaxID=6339 RepID=A0A183FY74_HELPZ|nr:unnamed protein product [Heligmosomoides polygyrus]